jgi:hypothetical protein
MPRPQRRFVAYAVSQKVRFFRIRAGNAEKRKESGDAAAFREDSLEKHCFYFSHIDQSLSVVKVTRPFS